MFETWFLLCLQTILANILLPLIPGIIFLRLCFGKKIQWFLLYILGWFIGVGVVAFSMFNLQFIHFGVGVKEYFIILWVLILAFIIKLLITKTSIKDYLKTLIIKSIYPDIKLSFNSLLKTEKIFTIIISIFSLGFIVTTFIPTTHFPTYADDSFGNRNRPTYHIYQDGGVKIFWSEDEILGRWRLWYPIYIPIYKAMITNFVWWFNDIYINMRQWLVFLGTLLFVFSITFQKTKNIFYSILPIWLTISLPLVFFHAGEWYMELASAAYSIITIRAFRNYLERKDCDYISLWLLSGFILSYVKNDWFVVYLPAILIALFMVLILQRDFKKQILWFFRKWYNWLLSGLYFLFFFLPFLIIKGYYNLWFNQAAWSESWIWISSKIHWEIFSVFGSIFTKMDNYNTIFIILALIIGIIIQRRNNLSIWEKFLLCTPLTTFIILLLVFLLTENYIFALNQTTVNRVFTIVFILLFSFSWYIFVNKWNE